MKSLLAALALTTALSFPAAAMARPVTLSAQLKDYGGNNAYLALYVTDKNNKYAGSLWLAGSRTRYFQHLAGWYNATGGDTSQINGITGASVGSGRTLEVTLDLKDALFDQGYKLHIDAAAENLRESPNDVVVPLTSAGAGTPVKGRRYISSFTYSM
ncbi:MAG: DUF2271 domain-containing protein [Aestuariivirga sp.]|uniref:DUF2271 domain-containing protein n=1 Tax=Aestuariivirga sp. TaxID=2650926 RepID=UPI0025C5F8E2|nr:DUF2271 domain-containing protein [Aestuariivirga sp.]MCA3562080.1 DUF2271 domain-containing protein [Aestuariivirga sp.]